MHTVLLACRYNPSSSDPGPCAVEMGEGGAVLMCALLRLRLAVVLFFFCVPSPHQPAIWWARASASGGDGGEKGGKENRPDQTGRAGPVSSSPVVLRTLRSRTKTQQAARAGLRRCPGGRGPAPGVGNDDDARGRDVEEIGGGGG